MGNEKTDYTLIFKSMKRKSKFRSLDYRELRWVESNAGTVLKIISENGD